MNSETAPMHLQAKAVVMPTCPLLLLSAVRSMQTHGLDPQSFCDFDRLKNLADLLDDRAHRLVLEAQQEALAMTERAQVYRALAATKQGSTETNITRLSKALQDQK